jgi:hypothetical protein
MTVMGIRSKIYHKNYTYFFVFCSGTFVPLFRKNNMNFKDFKECIDNLIEMHRKSNEAYQLKIDLIDYTDPYDKVIYLLWSQILTDNGQDWLSWYLYEKDGISGKPRKDMQAWDENGKEICKNLKNLHSFLVENSYFRVVKEEK